jgi:membrane protein YqaA with SNARE-associated domain|tara:strand:+ start:2211 stop:2660 length:450 start_codon:yes stop_codon:yes gene_type:complete
VIETAGYTGIWIAAFLGAALMFVPVGALAAVCVAATPAVGLNPLIVGVVAGSAEAVGELTGYAAGVGGKGLLERSRFYPKIHSLMSRYAGLVIFTASVIPNPVFDVMGVAAGSIRYPVRRFVLIVFAGKTIKFTWVGLSCYHGLSQIWN